MPQLIILSKLGGLTERLPHKILINGQVIGVMQQSSVVIDMPPGIYRITIQSMIPCLSSSVKVTLAASSRCQLSFRDRERWWNVVFTIDLVLWCIKSLLRLSPPWNWIYAIFTNGFFILWLCYEWHIRKDYFKIDVE